MNKQPQNRIDFILHCVEKGKSYGEISSLLSISRQRVGFIYREHAKKKDRCFLCKTTKNLYIKEMTNIKVEKYTKQSQIKLNSPMVLLCDKCNKKVDEIRSQ